MRTSELKKIVCDNGCIFNEILNDVVNLKNSEDILIGYVLKEESKQFSIYPECPKKIAQAILEYAYTPLEERGKEKKYYLKFPKEFSNCGYLNFKTDDNKYLVSGKIQEWNYKTQFTQKEIDEMPFDTNFFEKVLVE
jgi:hypothetical protein